MATDASISPAKRIASRLAICFAISIVANSNVYGQEAKLLNVQPASIEFGEITLYGLIQELPAHPRFDGTIFAIQVTASDSDLTTESRREAQGAPCATCTTMHYVLLRKAREENPDMLYRTAPGPVTYIHINNKEYMLGDVVLGWKGDEPHLKKVTLFQTGFAPPLFKRRLSIRFEGPVEFASEAEKIANMALRDAFAYVRPTTLRKVFPPDDLSQITTGSQ